HTPLNRGIAIAIIVWLNGPAASSVAAGVEAAAFQVACAQVEPAPLIATRNANLALVGAITSVAGATIRSRFAAAFTGEDLDHAADCFRAIKARTGTSDDLDAFDLVNGQVLPRDRAGRVTYLDAVDQYQ